jgi:hypothetical protein
MRPILAASDYKVASAAAAARRVGPLNGWLQMQAASRQAPPCRLRQMTIRAGCTRQRERIGPTQRQKEAR